MLAPPFRPSARPSFEVSPYHCHRIRCICTAFVGPFFFKEALYVNNASNYAQKTLGIEHYKALRRPKLDEDTAARRLEWARRYVEKPATFWSNWIFLDETSIMRREDKKTKCFGPLSPSLDGPYLHLCSATLMLEGVGR
ncbi:hypothetical protein L249_7036 [Ophiocordyceps polyrhachis-furcata BCC 54312]|uniref:Transposase Tc1-like domain-containing protein n=1 Tax=Ophiocordyceps polyrhachis-furcata BCC 54312 TaxID=1330021 RepID=A0A367LLW7_9HYPO|nr:hypothetical protein L249_7036 [Ophiocordyceps polyrhachis-furcata BCC 54312]